MITSIIGVLFRPALEPTFGSIHAMFHEPDDQSQNCTGRKTSQALQDCIRDRVGLIYRAGPGDHRAGERLQKIAAESTAESAGHDMANAPEAMFLRHGRRGKPADNAGDDLNQEIPNGPSHLDYPRLHTTIFCAGWPWAPAG